MKQDIKKEIVTLDLERLYYSQKTKFGNSVKRVYTYRDVDTLETKLTYDGLLIQKKDYYSYSSYSLIDDHTGITLLCNMEECKIIRFDEQKVFLCADAVNARGDKRLFNFVLSKEEFEIATGDKE